MSIRKMVPTQVPKRGLGASSVVTCYQFRSVRGASDNNWQQVITALSSGRDYGVGGATATAYREDHRSSGKPQHTRQRLTHRGTPRPATEDQQDHGTFSQDDQGTMKPAVVDHSGHRPILPTKVIVGGNDEERLVTKITAGDLDIALTERSPTSPGN